MLFRSLPLRKISPPLSARTQFHSSSLHSIMPSRLAHPPIYNFASDEIVDDSEPERDEVRKKGRQAKSLKTCSTDVDGEVEIISVAPTALKTYIPCDRSVIEISDSDIEVTAPLIPSRQGRPAIRSIIPPSRAHQNPANNEASTSRLQLSYLPDSSTNIAPKTLDLNEFAYTNPPIRKKLTAPARGIATATLPSSNKGLELKTSKILDIPTLDLAKISRCVSCDLLWTARKTPVQKMTHIKSCAKKNGFTDETIQLLIRKELANHVPIMKQSREKEKDSVSEELSAKDTYMDDILVGVASRKKCNRRPAQTVLANVSTTRGSILERAKTILAMHSTHDVNFTTYSTPNHSSKFRGNQDGDLLFSMQTFGQSALAQQQGAASSTLFSAINSSPIAPAIDISRATSLTQFSPNHASPSSPDIFPRAIPRKELRCDPIQSAGGPRDARISDSLPIYHLSMSVNEDGVKDHDSRRIIDIPNPALSTPPRKLVKKSKAITPAPPTRSADETGTEEENSTPTKRSRSRKMLQKKAKVVHSFDDKWESHMMEHILRDTNLYLRMLRYEPIDFNLFLEIAQRYAPLTGRLKLHLRAYLDKKAIHFYEGSRTRMP